VKGPALLKLTRNEWLVLLSAIAAVVGWLLVSGEAALGTIRNARDYLRNDAVLVGTWSNDGEGSVESTDWAIKSPEDLIWLSMKVEDGEITGVIHSPRLCSFSPWNYVQVDGSNSWFGTTANAYDFISGRRTLFGIFGMSVDGDGLLNLTPQVASPIFGREVRLARRSTEAADELSGVPSLCASLRDKLKALHPPEP
jgi:hypothetical protein